MRGQHDLILAIYPNARGFAYVVLQGSRSPVDWGISDLPRKYKSRRCLRRVQRLLEEYRPDALVLRHPKHGWLVELAEGITELTTTRGVPTILLSRRQIRQTFAYLASPTRCAIVEAIVKQIPMLASFVPGRRNIWNGEDRKMGLFDAVALALTFLSKELGSQPVGTS
jgi:hypothetical protein